MTTEAVTFQAKDCDRATVAVAELSDVVVVEDKLTTEDPFVIAALDANPFVERVESSAHKSKHSKAETSEAPADEPEAADDEPKGDS